MPAPFCAVFVFWCTDFGGPLSPVKITNYLEMFEERGVPAEARD